tara:strand:- start:21331 stop:21864 length:534 start_codon:yes stop_codon:yes gene_type:complete
MKIVFLDIDGVLNVPSAELGFYYALGIDFDKYIKTEDRIRRDTINWSPSALYNLYRIIDETKAKIVISSTWRLGAELDIMKAWFQVPLLQNAVIDKTPSFHPKWNDIVVRVPRGSEINAWIEQYKKDNGCKSIDSIAIIDDDSDMWPLMSDFFQTIGYDGLNWETASKIIEHLNKEK